MSRDEFDRWIGRNRPRLVRVARKLCQRDDVPDVVQTAIERIYRTATYKRVTHDRNLVAFFSLSVRQVAADLRRKNARRFAREEAYCLSLTLGGALQGEGRRRRGAE